MAEVAKPAGGKPVFPERGTPSMTAREYIAAHALQGVLSGSGKHGEVALDPAAVARKVIEYTDALLKAL